MVKNASQNYMLFYTCVTKEPTYLKSGKALTFLKTIAFWSLDEVGFTKRKRVYGSIFWYPNLRQFSTQGKIITRNDVR